MYIHVYYMSLLWCFPANNRLCAVQNCTRRPGVVLIGQPFGFRGLYWRKSTMYMTVPSRQLCRECQERYCQECFTSHHKKGALARHHPVLLSKPAVTANCNREGHSNPRPGSLLNGRFSEEDSAASFQEALLAWRRGEDPPGGQVGPEPSKKIEKKGTYRSKQAPCTVILISLGSKLFEIDFSFYHSHTYLHCHKWECRHSSLHQHI